MRESSGSASEAASPSVERFASYAAVALLTGFAAMTLQTVLMRIGGFSLGASHFTFAMVVAAFVACIALGSLVPQVRIDNSDEALLLPDNPARVGYDRFKQGL